MSSFKVIKKDKQGNIEKAAIMGAVAFYTKFKEPSVIYDQKDMPKNQQNQFEWTVEVVLDEETADAYDETSPKQLAKKVTKAQVAKKFKLMDEDGNPDDEKFKEVGLDPSLKKFYTLKKAQACQTKDGKSLKQLQPRAVEVVDGKPVDITFEKLIGNGSKVDLLLRYTTNKTYGAFSYPAVLKVTDLVSYEQGASGGLDSETQDFLGGDVDFAEAPEQTSVNETVEDFEEEPPFETELDEDDY